MKFTNILSQARIIISCAALAGFRKLDIMLPCDPKVKEFSSHIS